jgi:hypothetical protein
VELKKHFSDEQMVDLHMLIGLANLTNRVTGPLALEVEFPGRKDLARVVDGAKPRHYTITQLQNYPFVSYSPRDPLAIQIFEQRNCILAAHSCDLFEAGDVDFWRGSFERGDSLANLCQRALVEDQVPPKS